MLEIYDMQGKTVFYNREFYHTGSHLFRIATSNLPHGTYILNLYNDNINESFALIKSHKEL